MRLQFHVEPVLNSKDEPMFAAIASHAGHDVVVELWGTEDAGTLSTSIECTECVVTIIAVNRNGGLD